MASGKRHLASLVIASATLMLTSVPAGADPDMPEAIAEVYPAGLPAGGIVVDADTVSFLDGGIVVDVVPSAATDGTCPDGKVCLWEDANYEGIRITLSQCDTNGDGDCDWTNLAPLNFNDDVSSWWNAKPVDARWAYDANGGGTKRCLQPFTSLHWVGSADNDEASSLKIFKNANAC
jgi:hypothetical protein